MTLFHEIYTFTYSFIISFYIIDFLLSLLRVCVCVCVCGHVYVVYEDTNLYNDMGMT